MRIVSNKALCSFTVFSRSVCERSSIGLRMENIKRKCKGFIHSIGCLGCCTKPPVAISVDALQRQKVKQHSLAHDFLNTSSGDMDNSTFPSHRSISSICTSNQTLDNRSSAGGTSNPGEFVNHGLLLWNQTREEWVGNKRSQKPVQAQEPKLSWNTTYESLLGTNKPLPQPIPLAEMVDFLVDVWEQEGLYD